MPTSKPLRSRRSMLANGLAMALACGLGVIVALMISNLTLSQPSSIESGESGAPGPGAYHPPRGQRQSPTAPALPAPAGQTTGTDIALAATTMENQLPPELEERLRSLTHIATQPGRPGAPLPPSQPLSPDQRMMQQQALIGWQTQVQLLLDRCVARPEPLRQPATLQVMLAPSMNADGMMPQEVSPILVSLPATELRRLWLDTDPDALQGCLDQVRMLAVSVPVSPPDVPRVLPGSLETLRVTL